MTLLARTFIFFAAFVVLSGVKPCRAASSSSLDAMTWRTLRIGGGGFLTGLDFSADGSTRVVRTDTYGAYIWDASSAQWVQLVTASSMPAIDVKVDNGAGVYEIRVAPKLPTRLYMTYQGHVYKSDNRGKSWALTNLAKFAMDPNDSFRARGQKMAVDPANPDVVYVGTPRDGLFVTSDGGNTWRNVSAIPASQHDSKGAFPGISGIEFDPALGATAGKTKTIFAASYGNGIYESTDGGTSWSSIGGPTNATYAAVSSTGVYYVAADDKSLWRYRDGTWSELLNTGHGGLQTVAVDPFNAEEIVVQNAGGSIAVSYDGGTTWGGLNIGLTQLNSPDIPWLADSGIYMTIGGTIFDPVTADKLWASSGVGIWNTNIPTKGFTWRTRLVWNDQSIGIEQLVANEIVVPPGGRPLLASWDRPVFYVSDPAVFPSAYGPDNQNAIVMGWALDYASTDPTFIVGLFNWSVEKSGYSQDGGRTWKAFATTPPTVANGKIGGSIAASTPKNIVWAPSNNSPPYYSQDGGATWIQISIDGVPATGETGWGFAYYLNRHIVAADRVTAGVFYIYNYLKGLYRSTDGGTSWAHIHSHEIAPWSGFNAELQAVPGHSGSLFFTSGPQGGSKDHHPAASPFMRSIDGGETWFSVPNVLEVRAFGFGKPLGNYPTIFVVGWVNRIYGIWRSDDNAHNWVQIGDFPLGSLDAVKAIEGDKSIGGMVFVGFGGSGYAYGVSGK